ncbi:MAG: sortase [Alkaliphilus sp.]
MRKRKTRASIRIIKHISIAAIVIGLMVVAYPFYTDFISDQTNDRRLEAIEELNAINSNNDLLDDSATFKVMDTDDEIDLSELGMAVIRIESIDLAAVIDRGTSYNTLTKAVGWYTESALPGEGTTALAAHRSMFGAIFKDLHLLKNGDIITLEYEGETFTYSVDEVFTVESDDWSVIDQRGYQSITLTTCYPTSNEIRRVVFATMQVDTE